MNEQCMYCMQDTAGNHEYDCPMHPRHWEKRTYHMGSPHIVPKVFGNIMLKKEDMIDDLIMWINQSKSENDKFLMKEDLKMLMSWTCKKIYSSESTNEYIEIED